jgi:hypothetical protein
MKKTTILTLSFVLIYLVSAAQTQKGTQTLGLNSTYTHSSNSHTSLDPTTGSIYGAYTQTDKSSGFSISPNYSYFIGNGSELGGSLSYTNHKSSNATTYANYNNGFSNDFSSNSYGASIFFSKYVLFADKFGFRTGPYAGYQQVIIKGISSPTPDPNSNYTTNGYNIGANFDLVYYPSTKLGLAATIANVYYTNSKTNNASVYQNKSEYFNFDFIQGLNLSVFYVFGGK